MTTTDDRRPTPDRAEDNAFFPSPYSLSRYTAAKTDFDGADYPHRYAGTGKVLMIASQERYLLMGNGTFFSTGNHPVEMLLPMHHLDQAGFEIEIATPTGDPVKLEWWAFPHEDAAVNATFAKYRDRLKSPRKLSEVAADLDGGDYVALFVPGGHGVLNGVPDNADVGRALRWALERNKHIISLCHGPAALLAAGLDGETDAFPFKGYRICVFPDALDKGANVEVGYLPGPMPWLVGERLRALGVEILNDDITGKVHKDRRLLTGDSPLASNALGRLAAETLLADLAP